MTLPTGNKAGSRSAEASRPPRGFTLIELILVMTVMLIILALTAPSLGRFFRGRTLDSEARRLVTLTRFGQTRAVSEGVPMVLWLDPQLGRYGLEAEYTDTGLPDQRAVEYVVDSGVTLAVDKPATSVGSIKTSLHSMPLAPRRSGYQIRFTPDGFLGENSPRAIRLMPDSRVAAMAGAYRDSEIWIAQSPNRLEYEIQNNRSAFPVR